MNLSRFFTLVAVYQCAYAGSPSGECENGTCSFEFEEFVASVSDGYLAARLVAKCMGVALVRKVTYIPCYNTFSFKLMGLDELYLFRSTKRSVRRSSHKISRCSRSPSVQWLEKQVPLKRTKRNTSPSFNWNDPHYQDMWYITRGSRNEGYDMNVLEAWQLGYTGKGVVVSIMDDGLDYNHTDLRRNYDPMASYDFNDEDADPMPNLLASDNK
ncbi:hypothetical protein EG68_06568 [Paragonimus skrjabini miyazakii]|uniref:Uncharacterized protein n=1 Tax=Paragonimus skrjabini miyazakii TaxID=59628 RepID=A0A8S9YQX7_9TREM|nr:hypothetical protein EG68_06568 [Paragonimus skrjabini miyazakii]